MEYEDEDEPIRLFIEDYIEALIQKKGIHQAEAQLRERLQPWELPVDANAIIKEIRTLVRKMERESHLPDTPGLH